MVCSEEFYFLKLRMRWIRGFFLPSECISPSSSCTIVIFLTSSSSLLLLYAKFCSEESYVIMLFSAPFPSLNTIISLKC